MRRPGYGIRSRPQADAGIKIRTEGSERLKEVEGVAGFHVMAIEWEEQVPEIVEAARSPSAPESRLTRNLFG